MGLPNSFVSVQTSSPSDRNQKQRLRSSGMHHRGLQSSYHLHQMLVERQKGCLRSAFSLTPNSRSAETSTYLEKQLPEESRGIMSFLSISNTRPPIRRPKPAGGVASHLIVHTPEPGSSSPGGSNAALNLMAMASGTKLMALPESTTAWKGWVLLSLSHTTASTVSVQYVTCFVPLLKSNGTSFVTSTGTVTKSPWGTGGTVPIER